MSRPMDTGLIIACAVGLAVALGLGLWRRRSVRQQSPARGVLEIGIVLLVAVAAGALIHRFLPASPGPAYDADSTMTALKRAPLLRLVMADVPGAEQRLRAALEEDERNPVTHGATRSLTAIGELRASHIVPALMAADDKGALAAISARLAFIRHLQERDVEACRKFALVGIERPDLLDGKGRTLFEAMLTALEDAYRSGRDARPTAPRTLQAAEVAALLTEAGFSPAEMDKLGRLDEVPAAEACALAARFNTSPSQVASGRSGSLARHLLVSQ
jgi:hypothetical protein